MKKEEKKQQKSLLKHDFDKLKVCPKCKYGLSFFYDYSNDLWLGCSNCEKFEKFIKNYKDLTIKEREYLLISKMGVFE